MYLASSFGIKSSAVKSVLPSLPGSCCRGVENACVADFTVEADVRALGALRVLSARDPLRSSGLPRELTLLVVRWFPAVASWATRVR